MAKRILIVYHGDCPDGFGGAWAARKKFGSKAEYFAARRGGKLPDAKGREVYCIDFTPQPAAAVKALARAAKRLVLIDHHVSAKPMMALASEYWFSLERSGSMLAWQYFFPKRPVPRLLRYIEDGDLWKFELPRSREMNRHLELLDFDFKIWDRHAAKFERAAERKKAAAHGAMLLRYAERFTEKLARSARLVSFEGKRVYAVNSPVWESELGHALVQRRPPIAIIWNEEGNKVKVSLRSNGKFDAAKIAEKYGGGGHKTAAGFSVPRGKKLPWR